MKTHRIIIILLLCSIMTFQGSAQTPILHLNFDNTLEGTGGESPSFHNDNNPVSFVEGVSGNAGYFPSGNVLKYLAQNNINALRGTLCYWIRPDWNSSNDHKVFVFGESGGMMFGTDGNGYFASLINRAQGQGEIYANFGAQNWDNDKWYHVAQIWDRDAINNQDALKVYINGELIVKNDPSREASNIHEINASDFQIGGYGQDYSLNAALDELMIFSYPLNDQEIQAVYQMASLPVSLVLNFDNNVLGQAGEEPSLYSYNNPLVFSDGIVNQSAYFPEGNRLQFMAIENINDLKGTIHYWINTSWFEPANHCVFSYGYSDHYMKIELTEGNTFRFTISHNRQNLEIDMDASEWEPDSWHHLAHTWNSNANSPFEAIKTYFDGEIAGYNESEENGSLIQSIGGEFQIGADGLQNPLMAKLDLFTILDYELNNEEIRTLFGQHIPSQERFTLLLDFEDNLLGNSLEEPSEAMAVSFAEGKFGEALQLNPQNQLKYPFEGNIHPKKGSISCWVFPNWNNNNDHTLFQIDDGSDFRIGSDDSGEFLFIIGNPENQSNYFEAAIDTDQFPQQTWTHLTFTWNYRAETSPKAIQIYVNGQLAAQNRTEAMPWSIPSLTGQEIQIAGSEFQNTFSGKIDRFFILDFIPNQHTSITLLPGENLLPDEGNNGVIILQNKKNITVDGSNFQAKGDNGKGIFMEIIDCEDLTLTNFESINGYFYGIKLTNCRNIEIRNCNISANRKDLEGWINIWGGPDMALGGGIFMENCQHIILTDNILTNQNDGIAAYSCDNLTIEDNDCSQNTAYGIRLFHSDYNQIHRNNCSYVNRNTDPSDCASILLYFCRQNSVTYNNFSYGGDGIFINDNKNMPNSIQDFEGGFNYFAYNDCSHSPHNAIESVFSVGNIFEHNTCSFSHYGFWLGYSRNLTINNNIINHNRQSGIAIDRGSDNSLTYNILRVNKTGMEIWQDDSPISGYSDYRSQNYQIGKNYFIGNQTALLAAGTYNVYATQNLFITNWNGVILEEFSSADTLTNNRFSNTVKYHIINRSDSSLLATENSFGHNETALIDCKILDNMDGVEYSEVIWEPFIHSSDPEIQTSPPNDLAEEEFEWISFTEDGQPTIINWDSTDFQIGKQALHVVSESSTNVVVHYTPSDLVLARWDLSQVSAIVFKFKINHTSGQNLQQAEVFLGDECNGYFKFADLGARTLNDSEVWTEFRIPVEGNTSWRRSSYGGVDLSRISYFELLLDSWGTGMEFWLDGVFFEYKTGINNHALNYFEVGKLYPNPANTEVNIEINLSDSQPVVIRLKSIMGNEVEILHSGNTLPGQNMFKLNLPDLSPGVYILETSCKSGIDYQQVIINQTPYR